MFLFNSLELKWHFGLYHNSHFGNKPQVNMIQLKVESECRFGACWLLEKALTG